MFHCVVERVNPPSLRNLHPGHALDAGHGQDPKYHGHTCGRLHRTKTWVCVADNRGFHVPVEEKVLPP